MDKYSTCPVCGTSGEAEWDDIECELLCRSCGAIIRPMTCGECPVCESWSVIKRYQYCDCVCVSCGTMWDRKGQIQKWAPKLN